MDAEQIRQLEPKLDCFLNRFADCFARKDTRAHLGVYVRGQLSDLPEKSVEPIALAADVAPRTLQEFLSNLKWDEDQLSDRLQELVRTDHAGTHSIGLFDETSDPKKGDKTPGVQKQWCGRLGKTENCMVTVHLGYARNDFHCLLNGDLFLPESWASDRERCREAGIPDEVVYRPKWQIALELYDDARANGLHFDWLTFDEGYGSKPEFLRELSQRNQCYVAEVPRSFRAWLKAPRVVTRPYRRGGRGRGRRVPRLASGSPSTRRVEELLNAAELGDQPWKRWRIKESDKGPVVWECKHILITVKGADGLPGERLRLLVARNVLNPEEIKYFVSNAPAATDLGVLLLVAFSRWRVERCFQDQKSEIGLDQYEGRRYLGLKRHLILSAISYLFLAQVRQEWGEKSGVDGVPITPGDGDAGAVVVDDQRGGIGPSDRKDGSTDFADTATQCPGSGESYQDTNCGAGGPWHTTNRLATMFLGSDIAL
jgi:SRSO17 transposase